MTTIYAFNETETTISSTTSYTVPLSGNDVIPVYSANIGRTRKATIGSISAQATATSATSATTGTNIVNYGFTSLGSSSGPNTSWLLDPPSQAGLYKTITSVGTSTANLVTGSSSDVTSQFNSTEKYAGRTLTFSVANSYVELTSVSTLAWLVVGRSVAGVVCT